MGNIWLEPSTPNPSNQAVQPSLSSQTIQPVNPIQLPAKSIQLQRKPTLSIQSCPASQPCASNLAGVWLAGRAWLELAGCSLLPEGSAGGWGPGAGLGGLAKGFDWRGWVGGGLVGWGRAGWLGIVDRGWLRLGCGNSLERLWLEQPTAGWAGVSKRFGWRLEGLGLRGLARLVGGWLGRLGWTEIVWKVRGLVGLGWFAGSR